MDVGSIYPFYPDFDRYALDLSPSALRGPRGMALMSSLCRAFGELDDQQGEIIRQMDPNLATDAMLDRCGSRVFEPRGGLADPEYRRIINGRAAASASDGSFNGVWRTWLALSGANHDRARMFRYGLPSRPGLLLAAEFPTVPSVPFLRRAGAVLLDAVVYPFEVAATLYPAGGLVYDVPPGMDSGIIGWDLLTERTA